MLSLLFAQAHNGRKVKSDILGTDSPVHSLLISLLSFISGPLPCCYHIIMLFVEALVWCQYINNESI